MLSFAVIVDELLLINDDEFYIFLISFNNKWLQVDDINDELYDFFWLLFLLVDNNNWLVLLFANFIFPACLVLSDCCCNEGNLFINLALTFCVLILLLLICDCDNNKDDDELEWWWCCWDDIIVSFLLLLLLSLPILLL